MNQHKTNNKKHKPKSPPRVKQLKLTHKNNQNPHNLEAGLLH